MNENFSIEIEHDGGNITSKLPDMSKTKASLNKAASSAANSASSAAKSASNAASNAAKSASNAASNAANATLAKGKQANNELSNFSNKYKMNPIVFLLMFNFVLRLFLYMSTVDKHYRNKKNTVKHIKESFGIALVALILVLYIQFVAVFNIENEERSEIIKHGLILLIYFIVAAYDWINSITASIKPSMYNKKHKLGGIYFGIVMGSIIFFATLIFMLYVLQQVPMFKSYYQLFRKDLNGVLHFESLLFGLLCFGIVFVMAILGFFILNPNIKSIRKKYENVKEYFMSMFKIFYLVLIVSVILIMFLLENISEKPQIKMVIEMIEKFMIKK